MTPKQRSNKMKAVWAARKAAKSGFGPAPLKQEGKVFMPDPDATKYGERLINDVVNHPPHYKAHPSGIECIQITQHMNFCMGNAVKYIWRADEKGTPIEDLEKAKWYIQRELEKRKC